MKITSETTYICKKQFQEKYFFIKKGYKIKITSFEDATLMEWFDEENGHKLYDWVSSRFLLNIKDHFYTEKELRKLKLQEIKSKSNKQPNYQ